MNPIKSEGEQLARLFHDTYERLSPDYGYETRDDTKQFDSTTPNGRLMIAVAHEINAALTRQHEVELESLRNYKWMCEMLHGGYNADEKDVYKALKQYSEREDLRADFSTFFQLTTNQEGEK